jgi:cell wall-associated NlpC family hydrolase
VALGERYLGRPYVVGPLDGFGREVLVARLDSFDCFTYVEALLAMARGVAAGDTTFAGYLRRTEEQRYRGGEAGGYCDRLHYFTEWIYRNAERGIVRDVTAEAGGEPFPKRYGFMTAHRDSYPALADDGTFRCIARVEERLNEEVELYYIPQDRIAESYDRLRPGDVVAMATGIEGLDVTHTGLIYRAPDGSTGLLHASTTGGVKVSPDLQTYVQGVEAQVGVIVARPVGSPEP